jgi:hypothetical protein
VTASTNYRENGRRPGFSAEPIELEREAVLVLRGEFDLTGLKAFDNAVARLAPADSLVLAPLDTSR